MSIRLIVVIVNRCTATQALQTSYFSNNPPPTPGPQLPLPRSKKDIEREMDRLVNVARKRALEDDDSGGRVAKKLQF